MSIYLGTDLISGATKITLETFVDAFYPVGSVFIGITPTCPLAAIKGTWTLVGTSIVTGVSIPSTIPVYGNGKGIRVTCRKSGSLANFTLQRHSSGSNLYGDVYTGVDGTYDIGTYVNTDNTATGSQSGTSNGAVMGLVEDTNSGIIAKSDNITKTSLTVNIWERTA